MLERLFVDFGCYARIGLAVSGGPDSVALMHLARAWRNDRGARGKAVPELTVLTVDHGLRPGSDAEARQVKSWAETCGLRHETLTWSGEKPTSGIQAAARDARYGLLADWAGRKSGNVAIATAHHKDDQAETVLMRLARGSGPDGLSAMRRTATIGGLTLLRPLLDIAKSGLIELLVEREVAWIEDPSNDRQDFERVRLRAARDCRDQLQLTDDALALTARRMARAAAALEAGVDDVLARWSDQQGHLAYGVYIWRPESGEHPGAPEELRLRALARVLATVGGTDDKPELAQLERLLEQLDSPDFSGATLGRCQLSPGPGTAGDVLIHRETGREPLPTLRLCPGTAEVWDGRFMVSVTGPGEMAQAIEVRPYDEPARAEIMTMKPGHPRPHLPGPALGGLPAFWCGARLVAVPALDFDNPDMPPGMTSACRAAFLSGPLRPGASPPTDDVTRAPAD